MGDYKEQLDRIEKSLSKSGNWFEYFEKLIIPLLLLLLTVVTFYTGKIFNENQENRLRKEFKQNLEVKYIELFLEGINDKDESVRKNAINLTNLVAYHNKELSTNLLNHFINLDSTNPEEKKIAEEAEKTIEKFGVLNHFKVAIFYYKGNLKSEELAKQIKRKLEGSEGFKRKVFLKPSTDAVMEEVVYDNSENQIRYDLDKEENAKEELKEFLQTNFSPIDFNERPLTGNATINYISIFLEKK